MLSTDRVAPVGQLTDGREGRDGRPWRALAVFLLVLALVAWRGGPPPPVGASAPAEAFSADRAHAVLARILGDGAPHPVGTREVLARVAAELRGLGLEPREQVLFACSPRATCATVRNLIARIPGREPAAPAVLLSVHHDSVPAGAGAADDGAGVAALLEVARALAAGAPLRNPVVLLVDDGEEAGLLGAEAFATQPEARTIGAVVNLEARGTSGPSYLFETAPGNAWIARTAAAALERPAASSLFYEIYRRMPNDTDFTVWKRAGMQGANFAFVGDVMRYHTVRDDLAHLDRGSLQHHGQNALAMVRAFGEADLQASVPGSPAGDNAIFFDVLSKFLVWWPAAWNPVFAVAGALLLWTALFRLRRRGLVRIGELVWGMLGFVLAPLVAWLLTAGMVRALGAAGALPYPWVAQPMPILVATWLLGLLGALAAGVACGRRAGVAGAWCGAWVAWLLLGLLATWRAPGMSYLFLVPVIAAGLAALTFRQRGAPPSAVSLLPLALAALLWSGLLLRLYDALGWNVLPVVAALVALLLSAAAPHWITFAWRRRRPIYVVIAAIVLFASSAIGVPHATRERPEKLNLVYLLDAAPDAAAKHLALDPVPDPATAAEEAPTPGVDAAKHLAPLPAPLAANAGSPAMPDAAVDAAANAAPASAREAATPATGQALWLATPERDILPPSLAAAAAFERGPSPFPWGASAFRAPAPSLNLAAPVLDLLTTSPDPRGRRVRLRVRSQRGAPIVQLALPVAALEEILGIGGHTPAPSHKAGPSAAEWRVISVQTAPPEGVEIELLVAAAPFDVEILDRSYGLPAEGSALLAARPEWASPVGSGDVTVVRRRLVFPDTVPPPPVVETAETAAATPTEGTP